MKKCKKIYVIISIILFAILAYCIQTGKTNGIEQSIYNICVQPMSQNFTNIVKFITNMGDVYMVIGVCILLFIIPLTRKKFATPVIISVAISAILNVILKNIFMRPRPNILKLINETDYSFPSGHAMINSTLYAMIILLTWKYIKNKNAKIGITVFGVILTILIGYSRIYLGVHFAGDIIGRMDTRHFGCGFITV